MVDAVIDVTLMIINTSPGSMLTGMLINITKSTLMNIEPRSSCYLDNSLRVGKPTVY